jgi:S-adenosylmethionine:tRNA ribosyltransferase-isomerase
MASRLLDRSHPEPEPASVTATATASPVAHLRLEERHVATEPPEARGTERSAVRLLVSRGRGDHVDTRVDRIGEHLRPGDVLAVNTSGTRNAAIDVVAGSARPLVVHVSTELPGGLWTVEPRSPLAGGSTEPVALGVGPHDLVLAGGTALHLLRPVAGSERLWLAVADDGGDLLGALERHGRPIRYRYVPCDWPLAAYHSVFALDRTSAEMPSASRPFTDELVTRLVSSGVLVAPISLHTGVSSLEGHEIPYPEWFSVPATTADVVNAARERGGRVVAVGTTVVRALESAADDRGRVHPAEGWTDVVIGEARGVRAVDGLVTGWHEPTASHIDMLLAVASEDLVVEAYEQAWAAGYRWHEFGDSHLLLPTG